MNDLASLESIMREKKIVACNIHLGPDGLFRVHVRHNQSDGFHCAQVDHGCLVDALKEHFTPAPSPVAITDLTDLLV